MSLVCDEPVKQRCKECGGWYDRDAFFRKNPGGRKAHISAYRQICIGCETTTRTKRKKADRWLAKARSTIYRHAKKYGRTSTEFIRVYGWEPARVAHILEHAHDNTCPYCTDSYKDMPDSKWQVTMDIVNPKRQPFLTINTQPCCQTCNREKSNTDPEVWARKLVAWREWKARMRTVGAQPVQMSFAEFCQMTVAENQSPDQNDEPPDAASIGRSVTKPSGSLGLTSGNKRNSHLRFRTASNAAQAELCP